MSVYEIHCETRSEMEEDRMRITKDLAFMADTPRPRGDRTLIKVLTVLACLVIAVLVFRHCH
jgi:hypothetical protein